MKFVKDLLLNIEIPSDIISYQINNVVGKTLNKKHSEKRDSEKKVYRNYALSS